MVKAASATLQGEVFTVQPYPGESKTRNRVRGGRTFLLEVADEAASKTLLAALPMLDRLLSDKLSSLREQRLEEMVDFMAARLLSPGVIELNMAQKLAERHARVLNEFGYFTAEQLADAAGSQASSRSALADNWRKRRQVFAVPHPDKAARDRDVYPAFQFEDHKPIKVVQQVLEVFGKRKTLWKLALWFTSNNGWLPRSARPVDLLTKDPEAVVEAAAHDAEDGAA